MNSTLAIPPTTRPLGLTDQLWYTSRGTHGIADPFIVLCLKATHITSDDIVNAWALLRIRHPLLDSSISLANDVPVYTHSPAGTIGEALERAGANIHSSTFSPGCRDEAVAALRSRMADVQDNALDTSYTTSRLSWLTTDGAAGNTESILVIGSTHSVCDARSLFMIARQLLALLAEPQHALEELNLHFASGVPTHIPELPVAIEDIYPAPTQTSFDEQREGLEAYASLMAPLANPQHGITPTGSSAEDLLAGRSMRYVFSLENTAQLLRQCKSHNVTVTQFTSAALAIASLPTSAIAASTSSEPIHFSIPHVADLRTRLPVNCPDEVAIRITIIQNFVQLSSIAAAYSPAAIWNIAQQCTDSRDAFFGSQHLWHLVHHATISWVGVFKALYAGVPEVHAMFSKPSLPGISSLGNCDALLPCVYTGKDSEHEILVQDMVLAVRAVPAIPILHMWTFGGRLNLYLTHNGTHIAPKVMDAYFRRIIEVIFRFGVQAE